MEIQNTAPCGAVSLRAEHCRCIAEEHIMPISQRFSLYDRAVRARTCACTVAVAYRMCKSEEFKIMLQWTKG